MSEMTIRTSVDLNTSASAAWSLFGEGFGDWASWAPGLDSSTLEGPLAQGVMRVNQTPSLGTVRQELVHFDRTDKALSYEMRTLPPMFSELRSDWRIVEIDGGRSRLEGEARFVLTEMAEPMKDKLRAKMGMTLQVFANALQDHFAG